MERRWKWPAALLAMIGSGSAVAQDRVEGFYIGAGIGDFSANVDSIGEVDDADVDFDSDQDARRIFAGWRFNRFVSVNIDYTDFGESEGPAQVGVSADTRGLTPAVVGTLPLGPIELYGKAGVLFYDVEIDSAIDNLIDTSGEDAVIGAGIGATIFEKLNLRLEYERIDIEEFDDADAVWLSAGWLF